MIGLKVSVENPFIGVFVYDGLRERGLKWEPFRYWSNKLGIELSCYMLACRQLLEKRFDKASFHSKSNSLFSYTYFAVNWKYIHTNNSTKYVHCGPAGNIYELFTKTPLWKEHNNVEKFFSIFRYRKAFPTKVYPCLAKINWCSVL